MKRLRRARFDRARGFAVSMLLAALVPGAAWAGGGASCALSATRLAFGAYEPSSNSPSDFTATITLTCSPSGTAAAAIHGTVALSGPSGSSGRRLIDGPNHMRYQLFIDPARTMPWGNGGGSGGTVSISGVASLTAPFRQNLTVYGRILARQSDALVGNYTDQIIVVLDY